ncbi:O-antigen ligase family protein [Candidatus Sulfurimonas baltica]|uniref:O-antigen ligase-related domain-containing protein n=1 Tax=Candidatus Sulfurimonas baltica TaxID=2740404 RepID=A0A7S7RMK4_9BACT|nr:O-antigen ligase family protein [Candidatus Sulfurimonas baltica]QOY51420.1 hypothetical protein HUE88_09850 [Candidatus Sulfurimonas baltica]
MVNIIYIKINQLNNFRISKQNEFTLYANYLLVAYAFFLPIYASTTRTIFSVIVVLFLLSGNIKEKFLFAIKDKVVLAFVLFYFMHLVWMLGSQHIDIASYKLANFRYILYIILFVAIIREDFIYKILAGFILGIFFSEIISYLMLMGIHIPYLQYSGGGTNVPFMSSYTQYSTVLSISMGILLYGIITIRQHISLKLLYVFFFISASSNIFIIQSKLGYGLYAISILVVTAMITIKHKKYWMIPISIVLIIGGYILAYSLSNTFHQRVNSFFNETAAAVEKENYHTSTGTRIGFHKYGYDLLQESLLFGFGTGDHQYEFLEYIKVVENDKSNYNSMKNNLDSGSGGSLHSEFLDNSLQFGIIGLVIFLNIFYQLLKYQVNDYYLKIVQVIFVVILLATASVNMIFLFSKIGKIFTLLSALTLKLYYNKEKLKKLT